MFIILASKSRDRKKLFEKAQIPVKIFPSNFNEDSIVEEDPYEKVMKIAEGKAKKVLKLWNKKYRKSSPHSNPVIIAADTMVLLDGELIGKATNKEEAFRTLKRLSGKGHQLITGVCIIEAKSKKKESFYDKSIVYFHNLSDGEIKDYLSKTDEYRGRAGAYSLGERASLFIERIEGSPTNVLGLPMAKLRKSIKDFDINLLSYE